MTSPAFLFADVIEKLKTTVHHGRSFDAAQVRLVGLDDIREAAGENWDQIKERVRANSLDFLQGCLGREDIVIPAGDGFLIIYGEAPDRDITRESKTLQDALNAFYISAEGMEKLRSKVRGVTVDANNMHSVLDFDGSDLDFVDDEAAPDDLAIVPRQLLFAPVWSVAQEVIATYFVSVAYRDENGARRYGHDPAFRAEGKLSGETFLDLDLKALETALAAARLAVDNDKKCLIGFSVHSTTLQRRPLRAAYLAQLSRAPLDVRKYITIRIAEVERGAPMITLSEWVGVLHHVCQRVSVELHPNEPNVQGLEACGAWAIGCYLPLTGPASPAQQRHYAAIMGRWAPLLRKQNLKYCVDNLVDPVLIDVARQTGVDFITSETVWPLTDKTAGVVPFSGAHIGAAFGQRRSA